MIFHGAPTSFFTSYTTPYMGATTQSPKDPKKSVRTDDYFLPVPLVLFTMSILLELTNNVNLLN